MNEWLPPRENIRLVLFCGGRDHDEPAPDWQTAKIDAACDFWELQMMGIKGC